MSSAVRTQDHDTIRRWAEERGGVPSIIRGTGGMLRIDFVEGPGSGGHEPSLQETSWDEWFQVFDDSGIDFLYSPEPENRFFKLVQHDEG